MDDYPVAGATVRVEGTDHVAVGDEHGCFRLDGAAAGPVRLIVEAGNYATLHLVVPAEARGDLLRIPLVWDGEAFYSVTVARTRPQPETASTARIGTRELTSAPRRNAEEVLRQVPGLTLVQHGSEGKGHQFFLRGFDAIHGADLELSVDGMPLNEWSNVHAQGYLDLAIVIPELIRELVVTKGPFTLEQGAFGMAGSVDYQLGVPDDDTGLRASYTAGTTNRHRVFVGYSPRGEGGHQFVGLEATHDDGFGSNRALNRVTLNGRVRLLELDGGGTLHLTGLGGYSAFELPGTLRNDDVEAGLRDFYGTYDALARGRSARGLVALSYDREGDDSELHLSAYGGFRRLDLRENFTGFLIDPNDGDRREQRHEAWSFGLSGTHVLQVADRFALRTALGVRGEAFSQRESRIGRDLEPLEVRRDLQAVQLITFGYAGLRWTPLRQLRIDVGARLDLIHVSARDALDNEARGGATLAVASPRLTASWRPSDAWKLTLAYGRGFRPPEARSFSSFDPGRAGVGEELFRGGDPVATVSDAIEAGVRWEPISAVEVSLSGFATFIERESIFDHVSGVNLELNGTRRIGAELVVQSSPVPWLSLGADVTIVDARFTASGDRVPLAPRLVSGLRAAVTHETGFRAGLRVLAVASRPLPHGAGGATLLMTDATLGYHWQRLRLDLEVENVLNRQLREGEYHYASHWRPGEPASEIPVLHTTAGPPVNARLTIAVVF